MRYPRLEDLYVLYCTSPRSRSMCIVVEKRMRGNEDCRKRTLKTSLTWMRYQRELLLCQTRKWAVHGVKRSQGESWHSLSNASNLWSFVKDTLLHNYPRFVALSHCHGWFPPNGFAAPWGRTYLPNTTCTILRRFPSQHEYQRNFYL
jgi:hypothetical protein